MEFRTIHYQLCGLSYVYIIVPTSKTLPMSAIFKAPKPEITDKKPRTAIPLALRHEVWSRDKGRCTWTEVDGTRCPERMMLELDHSQRMHGYGAGGGLHQVDNLRLTCRRHNQQGARERLGVEFWWKKRQEWSHTF